MFVVWVIEISPLMVLVTEIIVIYGVIRCYIRLQLRAYVCVNLADCW